jgi:hypothetical protein
MRTPRQPPIDRQRADSIAISFSLAPYELEPNHFGHKGGRDNQSGPVPRRAIAVVSRASIADGRSPDDMMFAVEDIEPANGLGSTPLKD